MSEQQGQPPVQEQPKTGEQAIGQKPAEQPKDAAAQKPSEQPKDAPKAAEPSVVDAGKDSKAKEPTEQKPVVPEKYDLKLPEGSYLDAARVGEIAEFAKQQGFSNEQAQALLDGENKAVSTFVEKQQQELKQKPEAWLNEAKADKELGGDALPKNVELAKRALERYGSPTLIKTLNETGLGNHPELIRVFFRIGKAMDEDQLVLPKTNVSGEKQDPAEVLYGRSNK